MSNASDLDTALDICGHKYRRIVLAALANQQQSMSIDDLTNAVIKYDHHLSDSGTDEETIKRVHAGLSQVHLPKLADSGLIQYDPERKVAESTAQVGQGDSNLSTILGMDSDLPTIS